MGIQKSVRKTIEWYRDTHEGTIDAYEACCRDIVEYSSDYEDRNNGF